jgi:hypothetical protein
MASSPDRINYLEALKHALMAQRTGGGRPGYDKVYNPHTRLGRVPKADPTMFSNPGGHAFLIQVIHVIAAADPKCDGYTIQHPDGFNLGDEDEGSLYLNIKIYDALALITHLGYSMFVNLVLHDDAPIATFSCTILNSIPVQGSTAELVQLDIDVKFDSHTTTAIQKSQSVIQNYDNWSGENLNVIPGTIPELTPTTNQGCFNSVDATFLAKVFSPPSPVIYSGNNAYLFVKTRNLLPDVEDIPLQTLYGRAYVHYTLETKGYLETQLAALGEKDRKKILHLPAGGNIDAERAARAAINRFASPGNRPMYTPASVPLSDTDRKYYTQKENTIVRYKYNGEYYPGTVTTDDIVRSSKQDFPPEGVSLRDAPMYFYADSVLGRQIASLVTKVSALNCSFTDLCTPFI